MAEELTESQKQVAKYEVFYAGTKIHMGAPVEKPKVYIAPTGEVREYAVPKEEVPLTPSPPPEPVKKVTLSPFARPVYHEGKLLGYEDPIMQATILKEYVEQPFFRPQFYGGFATPTRAPTPITITPTEPTLKTTGLPVMGVTTIPVTPTEIKPTPEGLEYVLRPAPTVEEVKLERIEKLQPPEAGLFKTYVGEVTRQVSPSIAAVTAFAPPAYTTLFAEKPRRVEMVSPEQRFWSGVQVATAVAMPLLPPTVSIPARLIGRPSALIVPTAKILAPTIAGVGAVGIVTTLPKAMKGDVEAQVGLGLSATALGLGLAGTYYAYRKPYKVTYVKVGEREAGKFAEVGKGKIEKVEVIGKKEYPVLREIPTKEIAKPKILKVEKKGISPEGLPVRKVTAERYKFETFVKKVKKKPEVPESVLFYGKGEKVLLRGVGAEKLVLGIAEKELLRPVKVFMPPKPRMGGLLAPPALGGKEISFAYQPLKYGTFKMPPQFAPIISPPKVKKEERLTYKPEAIIVGRRRARPPTIAIAPKPRIFEKEEITPRLIPPTTIQPPVRITTPITTPVQITPTRQRMPPQLKITPKLTPPTVSPPTPIIPPLLPPISFGFPGEPRIRRRRKPRRKLGYKPSVAGIIIGRPIKKAPKGLLTGFEIRPPVIGKIKGGLIMARKRRKKRKKKKKR